MNKPIKSAKVMLIVSYFISNNVYKCFKVVFMELSFITLFKIVHTSVDQYIDGAVL